VANNKKPLPLLGMMLILGVSACAHQSKIKPSEGHIDGANTAMQQTADNAVATKPTTTSIPKPVTSNTYLPPPKPQTKEQVYSIVVYDTPVKEVLFAMARDSKLNIDIHPSIQGSVTLNAVDQTLPAILERLSRQVDLTYKIQNNVLTITPDSPVLRTYSVDYVNMSRDTTGFIGAAAEISSAGQGAVEESSSSSSNNSSRTSITSESKSHFWETLEKNIKDILAETDKEVIVGRTNSIGNNNQVNSKNSKQINSAQKEGVQLSTSTELSISLDKQKEDAKNEYKTLFAGTVIVNREAGIINVRATSKQHEKVQEFLDKVMGSAKRQVLIEATIVEVRLNDSYQAGIDWSRLGGLGSTGFIFSQVLGPQIATSLSGASIVRSATSPGIVAGYVNGNRGILSSVQLLEQFGKTAVLSSPKLMVLNNQTAVLKVVDNLVYFTVKTDTVAGNNGSPAIVNSTSTVHTVPVGVVMTVTPQINNTGNVNINVRPTISRAVGEPAQDPVNEKNKIPVIQVREMESMLQIASGNTAVLGGLMQDEIVNNTDKVPGVSKIPAIGKVFTGKNDTVRKTELVIFLRPTVIVNASLESDELSSYKQYLPSQALERALETEAENER
jgi:general secretion pathway protein D